MRWLRSAFGSGTGNVLCALALPFRSIPENCAENACADRFLLSYGSPHCATLFQPYGERLLRIYVSAGPSGSLGYEGNSIPNVKQRKPTKANKTLSGGDRELGLLWLVAAWIHGQKTDNVYALIPISILLTVCAGKLSSQDVTIFDCPI